MLYCLLLRPSIVVFFLMIRRPPRSSLLPYSFLFLFFFNDTATTEIYTLSLHDALPISISRFHNGRISKLPSFRRFHSFFEVFWVPTFTHPKPNYGAACHQLRVDISSSQLVTRDRKSTRLNSSHTVISYAVFCLKQKQSTPPDQRGDVPVCRLTLDQNASYNRSHVSLSVLYARSSRDSVHSFCYEQARERAKRDS